jgi:hypothetical protein
MRCEIMQFCTNSLEKWKAINIIINNVLDFPFKSVNDAQEVKLRSYH